MNYYRAFALFFFGVLFWASPLGAGTLIAPSVKWALFSVQAKQSEPTVNYHGLAGSISLGYSVRQILDIAVFASYTPGKSGKPEIGREDASLIMGGGELAVRIKKSIYLGVRGGIARYHLMKSLGEHDVPGRWAGPVGGLSVGGFIPLSKYNYLQTSLDFAHIISQSEKSELGERDTRRFDQLSLSLTYVFNSYTSYRIDKSFFGKFISSF